ncbi:isochorismate synthase [Azorhizophilus paspali]|uniref:isochorismate synthase n=1 Tax=Azorhizophilus paspali TaxID=69963 RepID=UPI00363DC2FA
MLLLPWDDWEPISAFSTAGQGYAHAFFWAFNDPQLALVGLGQAAELVPQPGQGLVSLQQAWREMLGDALIVGPEKPHLLGGLAFDRQAAVSPLWSSFAYGALVLPEILLIGRRQGSALLLSTRVSARTDCNALCERLLAAVRELASTTRQGPAPTSERNNLLSRCDSLPADCWKAKVADAVDAIGQGRMEKVVLARQVDFEAEQDFSLEATLRYLRQANDSTYLFAIRRGEHCFLGATPERLVRLEGRELYTTALAGSTPRGHGPDEDLYNGNRLLDSAKDRHEHALVVNALKSSLEAHVETLQVPAMPSLHKLPHIQHLQTLVRGRVRPDVDLLTLVDALHPTPAVGGVDKEHAIAYIRDQEGLNRGWYAAPVGWLNSDGNGEFAVALRSALIHGRQAHLFAGCGIVEGSDPEHEYQETCVKLRTMISALMPEPTVDGCGERSVEQHTEVVAGCGT